MKLFLPKEWRWIVQFDFSKILDLIKAMVTPEQGSKFLLSAIGLGAIVYMHKIGIDSEWSDVTIGAVLIAYYVADSYKRRLMATTTEVTNAKG